MEEFHLNGFVLRAIQYGESDLILTILTAERGKVKAIAKGAKRSKKRFAGGALEPFQELALRLSRREHRGLDFLHESRVIKSNIAISSRIDAFAWASYLTELTEKMTVEDDPCPEIFDAYGCALGRLRGVDYASDIGGPAEADGVAEGTQGAGAGSNGTHSGDRPITAQADTAVEAAAHRYILELLAHGGWAPDFERCGICSAQLCQQRRPVLDHRGGLICAGHEAQRAGLEIDDPSFRPSRRIIDEDLLAYVREAAVGFPAPRSPERMALASALLDRLLDLHLSRVPKSRSFLISLRVPLPKATQGIDRSEDGLGNLPED